MCNQLKWPHSIDFKHLGVVGFHYAAATATGKHRHGVSTMRHAFKYLINIVKTIIFSSFRDIDCCIACWLIFVCGGIGGGALW